MTLFRSEATASGNKDGSFGEVCGTATSEWRT